MLVTISSEVIEIIRKEVKNKKSKLQVSKEFNVPYKRVLKHTKDIKTKEECP
jgi:hypothetical protein